MWPVLNDYVAGAGQPILAALFFILAVWLLFGRRLGLVGRRPMSLPGAPPDRLAAAVQPLRSSPRGQDDVKMATLTAAWIAKGTGVLHRPVDESTDAAPPAPPSPPSSPSPLPPAPPASPAAPSGGDNWLAHQVDVGELIRWGKQAAREGDLMVAHRLFVRAVEIDPSNEDAWLWLAGTSEQPEEAVRCLEQVLRINPFNERAHRGLSDATRRLAGV